MNYGLVNKPKSGATLRVWELADSISEQMGRMARRKEVIERFVGEGGNPNTASTQFQYWKMAQEESGPAASDRQDAEAPSPDQVLRLDVASDGTLKLPPDVLRGLEVPNGGILSGRLENGQLTLVEPLVALRRVQEALRPYRDQLRAEGRSAVDELIAGRRAETAREALA